MSEIDVNEAIARLENMISFSEKTGDWPKLTVALKTIIASHRAMEDKLDALESESLNDAHNIGIAMMAARDKAFEEAADMVINFFDDSDVIGCRRAEDLEVAIRAKIGMANTVVNSDIGMPTSEKSDMGIPISRPDHIVDADKMVPVADADGWIAVRYGGDCPVGDDVIIDIKNSGAGEVTGKRADYFDWWVFPDHPVFHCITHWRPNLDAPDHIADTGKMEVGE